MIAFTEGDGLVLTMLAVMVLSFSIVLIMVATIRRNSSHRNREVEELIEEVAAMEREKKARRSTAVRSPENKSAAWEQDADWWKQ